ncbi:putative Fasciclin-2 precursor [Danaus plexippus plexippus]|uniref:Fasciclin-2 n=1 Tax=Danaus plexippus plexippus TaxID=278856 RepID=A0A212EN40_DANPL|nr:putative Fasciclin-2 precursor [Danaus plexippus plexippus]
MDPEKDGVLKLPTKNLIDPTGFDVTMTAVLIGLGAEKYIDVFRKHNIGQCTLMELNDEDLTILGVDDPSIRRKLIEEVKNLPTYDETKQPGQSNNLDLIEIIDVIEESTQHLYRIYLSMMTNTLALKKNKVEDYLIEKDKYASNISISTLSEMTNILNSMDIALHSQIKVLSQRSRERRNKKIIVVEAILGQSAELPCNVTAEKEDDKLNILAWYRNGSTTAFYSSRDLRGAGSVMSSGGRYRLVASESEGLDKLQILSVRASDAGLYHCHADFATKPPQRLWVIHENGTRVTTASIGSNTSRNIGPYYVGDTVHLFCVAFGGKPQSSLSWWADQRMLKDTSTPLSEQRVRSDLMYGPLRREDHGRVLTCFAKNNERTPPLTIDVTIDMFSVLNSIGEVYL